MATVGVTRVVAATAGVNGVVTTANVTVTGTPTAVTAMVRTRYVTRVVTAASMAVAGAATAVTGVATAVTAMVRTCYVTRVVAAASVAVTGIATAVTGAATAVTAGYECVAPGTPAGRLGNASDRSVTTFIVSGNCLKI